jgi:predicted MFS family arabinose efflux permease
VLGPLLGSWIGVAGIFWLTAVLAILGIGLILFILPTPRQNRLHRDIQMVPALFQRVLKDSQLLRLDLGIFILHMILTATFVGLPFLLRDRTGLTADQHWHLYLPAMLLGLLLMVPFIFLAERKHRMKIVFLGAIAVMLLSQLSLLLFAASMMALTAVMVVFFAGINFLEACLPSLIARLAPPDAKGTALGIYSTSQFFGAFCGGAIAGGLHGSFGIDSIFIFSALAALLWFVVSLTMHNPRHLSSYL